MRPERSTTTCQQCSTPLTPYQIYRGYQRCSRACVYADQRHEWAPRSCERCGVALTRRQLKDAQRFCSRVCAFITNGRPSCALDAHPAPAECALLAVLEGQGDWLMTFSDAAFWVYGDDSPADINAIRNTLYRLRRKGYRFETRIVGWPTLERWYITGIRLVSVPDRQVAA